MYQQPSYLIKRGSVFYFSRRVPFDLKPQFNKDRVTISLRTGSEQKAINAALTMSERLELYWERLRLENFHTKELGLGLVQQERKKQNRASFSLEAALVNYLKLKGEGRGKTFYQSSRRNMGYLIECLGSDDLSKMTPVDAGKFRDYLFERNLSASSIRRIFSTIKAIINLAIKENGLNITNTFAKTYIPLGTSTAERPSVPLQGIRIIQTECYNLDDESRWLIALLADTGMRLAEGVGLLSSDLCVDEREPYLRLTKHPWRTLKTSSSVRDIPLVGSALWAAIQIKKTHSQFAFPKYCTTEACNSNSASAALNKWLKPRLPNGCVVHSFRHSLRDRLRAVECPSDLVDALGGWTTSGVGQKYGHGYDMQVKHRWMSMLEERGSRFVDYHA